MPSQRFEGRAVAAEAVGQQTRVGNAGQRCGSCSPGGNPAEIDGQFDEKYP
jgi:hypothetical protein